MGLLPALECSDPHSSVGPPPHRCPCGVLIGAWLLKSKGGPNGAIPNSKGPLEARSPQNLKKTRRTGPTLNLRAIVYFAAPVLHPEAPDLASAHSGKAATEGSAGAG